MQAKVIVRKIFAKPWAKGAIFGFIFGVLLAAVSAFELFHGTALQIVPQFLGALPAFIIINLLPDALELFVPVIYSIYWIVLGALIGWGISKGKLGKGGVVLFVLIVIFAHYKANIALQKEIGGALEALAEFLRMLGGPLPPTE
jgi:hypothetical protein